MELSPYQCREAVLLLLLPKFEGNQQEYSSKPLKHNIVECILVFKR